MSTETTESPLDQAEKINTYTSHPAYQEAIVRSKAHNTIRAAFGWFIIVAFSVALLASAGSSLFNIYQTVWLLISTEVEKFSLINSILRIAFSIATVWISFRFMQWGRHLTRPTSREWV